VPRKLRLKPLHAELLGAIRALNEDTGCFLRMAELRTGLPAQLQARLALTYDVDNWAHRLTRQLCQRGFLVCEDLPLGRRGYAVADLADRLQSARPPTLHTTRECVLVLIRSAVARLQRPIRGADVVEEAALAGTGTQVQREDVLPAMVHFAKVGVIRDVRDVRGDPLGGRRLYLPAELDPADYRVPTTVTFAEYVHEIFRACWARECARAWALGEKPLPITIAVLREALRTADPPAPDAYRRANLLSVVDILARASTATEETLLPAPAVLRRVTRPPGCSRGWVPVEVPDEAVELRRTYASTTEALREAVWRASHRLARPVTQREIGEEIARDPLLARSRTRQSLAALLSWAARRTRNAQRPGEPRVALAERIYGVGQIGHTCYYVSEEAKRWESWVRVGQLERDWTTEALGQEYEGLCGCALPTVAAGRAMLLVLDASQQAAALARCQSAKRIDPPTRARAAALQAKVEHLATQALEWLGQHPTIVLPEGVRMGRSGSLQVCLEDVRVACEAIEGATPQRLSILIQRELRRVLGYRKMERQGHIRHWHQGCFDLTDVRLLVARTWGGRECCAQAVRANHALGRLRDARFVYPAVRSPDPRDRLTAVACLAFLPSRRGIAHLSELGRQDAEGGVRQAALWAYAFAGGDDALALLSDRAQKDPDPRVRRFAGQGITAHGANWWAY
jgi:hypothetical protein